jgi:hypothetical protein
VPFTPDQHYLTQLAALIWPLQQTFTDVIPRDDNRELSSAQIGAMAGVIVAIGIMYWI